jgi:alpha-L-fucosidase
VPLPGHEWFWTPNQRTDIEPLPRLLDMYYRPVGRNCNLLLNATPGPDGLIPEANWTKRLRRGMGGAVWLG